MTNMPPSSQNLSPSEPKKRSPLVWILGGCAVLLLIGGIAFSVFLWWGYHKAKNYAKEVIDSETSNMKNVGQLWSDVPPMEGMNESQQVDIPGGMKLVARKMMDGMMRGVNDGKDAGHWDWTGYSLKNKKPGDIQSFYTTERMKDFGWKPEGGCMNMNVDIGGGQAILCAFQKQEGNKMSGLLVIGANDKENNSASVFFIRQEAIENTVNVKPATENSPASDSGANVSVPYGVDKKPKPEGLNLDQLLPLQVGNFKRESIRQVGSDTPPTIAKMDDGNPIIAEYFSENKKIFLEFGAFSDPKTAQEALNVAAGDTVGEFPKDPNMGVIGQEPSYLKAISSEVAFFAWTRGGYYFSASAPNETALNDFMQAFPY